MENQKSYKTPPKTLAMMQVVHFGNILFNLQFLAIAIMAASVLSFIVPVIYYLLLLCVMLLTLFTIFIMYPGFGNLWSGGEALTQIAEVLNSTWKFTVPIVAVLAIGAIVCLSLDKQKKHIGKIVTCSIFLVLALIVLILKFINGGAA